MCMNPKSLLARHAHANMLRERASMSTSGAVSTWKFPLLISMVCSTRVQHAHRRSSLHLFRCCFLHPLADLTSLDKTHYSDPYCLN
jgi:hypothetical protein